MSTVKFVTGNQGVKFAVNAENVSFKFTQQKIGFSVGSRKANFSFCENKIVFRLGTGNNHWDIGVHTHVEADITDLDKYSKAQIDAQQNTQDQNLIEHEDANNPHDIRWGNLPDKPHTFPSDPHVHTASETPFDKNIKGVLVSNQVQGALDELTDLSHVLEYGAIATKDAGDSTIAGDVNATDWSGHTYADGSSLFIEENHLVTLGHGYDTAYMWVGPKPVKLGIDGDYVTTANDFQAIGTADHNILTNREFPDQHPMASITGLLADQIRQDQNLLDHEGEQANPHLVTHDQLTDITADQHHPREHAHNGSDGSGTIAHTDTTGITANDHHNQVHLLYGPDQSDVDTAAALAARHVLSRNTANDKFEPQYRTNFISPYVLGPTYYPQDEVLDGVYLMAANKVTAERAAPQKIGLPSFIILDPVLWTNHSNAQSIHVGMHVLVPAGKLYQVSAYRIWAENTNADYTYIVWSIIPDGSGGFIYEKKGEITGDNLQVGWNQFSYAGGLLLPGVEADLILEISNSADGQTVTGGWTRTADHNNNPPGVQGWNKDNNSTILRISTTDLDSSDRQNELMSIVSGSEIRFVDTLDSQYSVTYAILADPVLGTGVVTYTVSEVQQGPAGIPGVANTTTMTASIPTPSVVNYVDVAGKLSAYPNVTGRKSLTGSYVDAVDTQDGYQFDIEVQELEASDDWDVKAISDGGGGSSGGGGDFTPVLFAGAGSSGYVPDPVTESGLVLSDRGTWVAGGSGGGGGVTVSDTPPVGASNGDGWFDSKSGITAFWYEDGDSGQWIADPLKADDTNVAFVSEAPIDTVFYGRQDALWVAPVIADVVGLATALAGKSATDHNHNSVYAPITHTLGFHSDVNVPTPNDSQVLTWLTDHWEAQDPSTGIVDHGQLNALSLLDDDHEHYHTDARGDLRYSLLGHGHAISEITDLQTILDGKALSDHNHDTDYAAIVHDHDTDYSDINHNHDLAYAPISHTQDINTINGLQTALDGKAASDHNHDGIYAPDAHNHDLDYAALSHVHIIGDVTGLQGALDGKSSTSHDHASDYAPLVHNHDGSYEPLGTLQTSAQTSYDNTTSGISASDAQAAIDEISALSGSGVEEYGAIATAGGSDIIEVDVNAMDWTGHAYAVGTALQIEKNHILTFGNEGNTAYRWVGAKPALVGLGGTYITVAADFIKTGIGNHDAMSNLDLPDQHAIAVVTGLQTALNGKEAANANIQTHIGVVAGNPHGTTSGDVGADPAGSASVVQGNLDTHTGAVNPHSITPAGIGASLDTHNHDGSYDPSGSASGVQTNLDDHEGASNPHGISAASIGAEVANANIQTHIGVVSGNPHGTTAADVGAALEVHTHPGTYEPANANIQDHVTATGSNPHAITAALVGAVEATTVGMKLEAVAVLPGTQEPLTLYVVTG